ncbi:hypothetical protein EMPS_11575 [Entomortierella parvispora]|uniref:Uncharacterized protein n=1 Tax=Entomortierella parvispora TaxID=205924 RepID=A0A9P3HLZ7_9FUNG|nr:hypothetical protein EMPS_11575 [Entomortierella parvispora]
MSLRFSRPRKQLASLSSDQLLIPLILAIPEIFRALARPSHPFSFPRNASKQRLKTYSEAWTITTRPKVRNLKTYGNSTIGAVLGHVQFNIRRHLLLRDLEVVIALDEAKVAANLILQKKLISPSALKNRNTLFDDSNQIRSECLCGVLTPLSATLCNFQATLVVLGTAFSLQNADHVYSAVVMQTNDSKITNFPRLDKNEVSGMLSDQVDMEGCVIPEAKRRRLSGRARFVVDAVNRLTMPSSPGDKKEAVLDAAIDKSIEHILEGLRRGVRSILANDKFGNMVQLLCRVVLAYHVHGGKISFAGKDQADFVDKSLCKL